MEKYLLKLEDGTLARIDAVAENRAAFIRDAVERALGGSESDPGIYSGNGSNEPAPKREAPMRKATKPPSVDGLHSDDRAILRHLQGRRGSSERAICADLDWPPMRVTKAVNRLANAKMIVFPSPGYIRIAEDEAA
jgi:hypothetical protein